METLMLNYITPEGLKKLQDEFKELHHQERPELVKVVAWAASNGDRSENADYIYGKRRLREIDKRLHQLSKKIDAAQVIDPKTLSSDKVVFGATVSFENEEGEEKTYQIVGVDESDPKNGRISWNSPIAKSMLGKKVDDEVALKKPAGTEYLTITNIQFK